MQVMATHTQHKWYEKHVKPTANYPDLANEDKKYTAIFTAKF